MVQQKKQVKSVAQQNMKKVARKEVKAVLNNELETKKFFSRQNPTLNPQIAGLAINILQDPAGAVFMTQGSARNQFVGDTIDPQRLQINYICYPGAFTAPPHYTYRVLVVQAKGGGFPSATNVLASVGNVMTPYSHIDPIYQDTFTVLYDRKHILTSVSTSAVHGRIDIKGKRLRKIMFAAGTAGSIVNNAIAMLVYTDSSTINPLFGYQAVLSFKDA